MKCEVLPFPARRDSPTIDQIGVEERAQRFCSRSLKKGTKMSALKLAVSMLDVTTLEGADSVGKIRQMCQKAMHPFAQDPSIGPAAAVCVYPRMVKTAADVVKGSKVKVAAVATQFPSGQMRLKERLAEVRYAVGEGADEIDMVISRGQFLQGEYRAIYDEVAACKEACGKAHLKVILETGELTTYDNVRYASDMTMAAGADFIKTSTGKVPIAATLPVTLVMLQAIDDFYERTGRMVGMKPAGGISNAKLALQYLVMVREVLGPKWLTNEWFRFGASSLTNDLLMQIRKQETGLYQSGDYFTKD
ncbi:deoxyribose-phosphate aldolase [bacterium]|nr:deoxyribose-phosphate aldolase [Akkermansiaceae bacterium]MDB4488255.1 deoxyribose-phosphate aldolase [bacterium]MDA7933482.1 deoxyribose-phosphate aldolase [Akkermansiaceae bacterium]MDB4382472.1 deoxyribose-phosphate aldolase [Akkermansiaceae bacterium]MDB4465137.1 deoxyribose-phosphate aldolase [Akkermansiaceae bacterium]